MTSPSPSRFMIIVIVFKYRARLSQTVLKSGSEDVANREKRDKCYQLRAEIESLNYHAKKTFVPGRYLSFDEGGIANKSRFNPVRQYNSNKPDKYRIDFFIMANATSGNNFIYHIDVYQGKNATNAFIAKEAWGLPTTQKAVVNAVISSGIANDPDGMREIYMDNSYSAPTLFVLLREKYQILACGTIRTNRVGWNTRLMNVQKSDVRGTSLLKYDSMNQILFGQWKDNKVVSFISSRGKFGMTKIQRRVGPDMLDFDIPNALKLYTKDNNMGGVDNLDKDKSLGGSFTAKAMFRKWYRMGLMGILDFMIVNGRQAWIMSARMMEHRYFVTNGIFCATLAEELLSFKDESSVNFEMEEALRRSSELIASGSKTGGKISCCVCNLEKQFRRSANKIEKEKNSEENQNENGEIALFHEYYRRKNIVGCSHEQCSLHFHSVPLNSDRFIFQMDNFRGLTCYQIAHHRSTVGLWKANPDFQYKQSSRTVSSRRDDTRRCREKRSYSVSTSHPVYIQLRTAYGLDIKQRSKKHETEEGEEADDSEE
eukprot:scaffold11429_cov48-Cyclotella_meneghiniana.AAC.4